MVAPIGIQGLNAYDRVTLTDAFRAAALDDDIAFDEPSRDPERAGGIDTLTALVLLSDQAMVVLVAWIMRTRRKWTKITVPDGTVIEHRQESFTSDAEAKALETLRTELSGGSSASP